MDDATVVFITAIDTDPTQYQSLSYQCCQTISPSITQTLLFYYNDVSNCDLVN